MNEVQISIIEKVKTELKISDEVNAFDLHKILYASRNNSHPDLFEENLKEKATKRFQKLDELLKELKFHIDTLKLNQLPKDIALYEKNYETVIDKSLILDLEEKNKNLTNSLEIKKSEIERLKKELEKFQLEKSDELSEELKDIYRPTNSNFLVLGVSAFLILFINISTQITTLKESILKIVPFEIIYLNYFLFSLLIILVVNLLIKNQKYKKIQKIADDLKSSKTIKEFYNSNSQKHDDYFKTEYFVESDLETFINSKNSSEYLFSYKYYGFSSKYSPFFILKKIIRNLKSSFKIKDKKSLSYLKDIFIYNLLSRGLIKIGKSKKLDREFLID